MFSGVFWGAIKNGIVEIVKGYHMSSSSESSSSSSSSTSSTSSISSSSISSSSMWKWSSESSSSQSYYLHAFSTANTGDGLLNYGDQDPNWHLVEDPTHALGSINLPVYCCSPAPSWTNGDGGTPYSKWIHPSNGNGSTSFAAGYYTYETYFPSNLHFRVRARADNQGYIYFNGVYVNAVGGVTSFYQMDITSGFVTSGNNVLRIRSYNSGSYTGVQVECLYII